MRRFERVLLGAVFALAAWIIERQVVKAMRKQA